MNPMRSIRIEKITVNIGCGDSGEKLEKAKQLLAELTKKKIVVTRTHGRTTFGMAQNRPIGCKVTIRGNDAKEFLKKALVAAEKKLPRTVFDSTGNFSFGVKEHIDIPGVNYDPNIGIFGMDVSVTLERPGFRIKKKKLSSKVGKKHLIKPEEAIEWVTKNFEVQIV
ncbi:MAG: 50S ribosomal protein L5 [Candidatus Aenigmatarchaeota archaeon]